MTKNFNLILSNLWIHNNINYIISLFNLRANNKYNNINSYYTVYLLSIMVFKHLFDNNLFNYIGIKIKKREYSYYELNNDHYNNSIKHITVDNSYNISNDNNN